MNKNVYYQKYIITAISLIFKQKTSFIINVKLKKILEQFHSKLKTDLPFANEKKKRICCSKF